ncbi:MAG: PBP1A family penicillin-binding protein [Synergistaceae bacterium]
MSLYKKQVEDRDKAFSIHPEDSNRKNSIIKTFMMSFLIFSSVFAIFFLIFIKSIASTLPSTEEILSHEPSLATVIYDRNDNVLTKLFQENRSWVKIESVSPNMIKAILAAEDDKFYSHSGVRPLAILRAGIVDVFHLGAKQGGSTITQQLSRNLFLTKEKTIVRKAKEAILSLRLEKIYTKNQILEMYLNTIYMGHGAYGVKAAAKLYYNKLPSDLSITESAVLAGLVAAPEKYSPYRNKESCNSRREYVLRRMLDLDWISNSDYNSSVNEVLNYSKRNPSKNALLINEGSYFVSHILFKYLLPNYGTEAVYRGGLHVYTTIDAELQKKAEDLISSMNHEGALVALDPNTGEILALVGGRDFDKSKFNRATQAYRQPGSAFKPIVYASAIENGYRAVDHLMDTNLLFPNGWEPHNYSEKFSGEVTVMEAIAKSINTTAVRIAQITGVNNIIDFSRRIGITTEYLPNDLSIALGTASVTPLEMSVAFSSFANNGFKVEPYGIKEIKSKDGKSLEQNGPKLTEAISVTTSIATRSLLQQVTSWGTGTRANIEGYETFGKTGTTNEWTDAWFIGGVPGLVVVVYVGNDNHKPLGGKQTGAVAALPIWKDFVLFATKKLKLPTSFPLPSDANVESVSVCKKTGFIATGSCPATTILLPSGHAPASSCPLHGGDISVARSDSNAPQLLLAPIDKDSPSTVSTPTTPTTLVEANVSTPMKNHNIKNDSNIPSPKNEDNSYKGKKNEQDLMEKKYQDLLKKYNIS